MCAEHFLLTPNFDEFDNLRFPRFEAHSRAGRDVQPEAEGFSTIEIESRIGLEKRVMGPDLNGPVSPVDNLKRQRLAPLVQKNLTSQRR